MASCGLIVTGLAVPVGLIALRSARRAGSSILPRYHVWRVPWTGFEVVVAFLVIASVVPAVVAHALDGSNFFRRVYPPESQVAATPGVRNFESVAAVAGVPITSALDRDSEALALRGLWIGVITLPLQIVLLGAARRLLFPPPVAPGVGRTFPGRVALAVVAWLSIAPIVFLVHAVVILAFGGLEWPSEEHPLAKLTARLTLHEQAVFFFGAAVASPLVEEILFRGVLLGWLVGGKSLLDRGRTNRYRQRPPADRRVWPVLLIGVGMAVTTVVAKNGSGGLLPSFIRGPVVFAVVLLVGWAVLRTLVRKRRTLGAVYASASLFAAAHSAVWPSPVPLFALGLGLGWLAVRTRGVLAPAIVHALFNAVSVLFVLRGGGGAP